jgi:hypothetical protein
MKIEWMETINLLDKEKEEDHGDTAERILRKIQTGINLRKL